MVQRRLKRSWPPRNAITLEWVVHLLREKFIHMLVGLWVLTADELVPLRSTFPAATRSSALGLTGHRWDRVGWA